MKGLSLACFLSPCIFLAMTLIFMLRPNLSRVGVSVMIFASAVCALLAVYFVTPDNLGFLPDVFLEKTTWLDVLVALFVFAASFFGGWLQLYNLTNRGYSLRMLIDLLKFPHGVDPAEVVVTYANGHGLAWMYRMRLTGLVHASLVIKTEDQVLLTSLGQKIARLFGVLRAVYIPGNAKQ